ncbi:MAG: hypothetical protein HQK97_02730 [Nitrospirae bacterium]|nr:hypothetical protein [Nitrospirota bacterium]
MADHAVVVARMKQLKDGLKRQINVKVTHDALRNAYIEGLFAMGDRCVSPIVESLADGTDWEKACKERSIDASAYIYRKKAFDERLPWDFIDNGIDKASLWREYCKAEAL